MPQSSISTDEKLAQINHLLASMLHQAANEYVVALSDEWGDIFIVEYDDFRVLKFDEFYEQSKMRLSVPQQPVFDYIKAMLLGAAFSPCQDVLMLGLGGGSLVRSLYHFNADIQMTVVEIRPAVIELAFQYFSLPSSPQIQIIQADAKQYLTQSDGQFDVIFADLFWALHMDPFQSQRLFFSNCKRKLRDHGWLAINYEQHAEIDDKLLQMLYHYFDDVLLCAIPNGNAVILAGSLQQSGGMESFYQRLTALEARLQCKMDILGRKLLRLHPPTKTNKK